MVLPFLIGIFPAAVHSKIIKIMRYLITSIIIVLLGASWRASAKVTPVWSTGLAVPGEQILLYLVDTEIGEDLFSVRQQPRVQFAGVQVLQSKAGANPLDANRAMVQILPILVRPDKAGQLRVQDITVEYRSGRKQTVKIPPLEVCSTAQIKWYDAPVPYGALWYTYPKDAYVHQPVKACLKLFILQDCYVSNLPQMHSVGVKISTLQPAVQGVLAMVQGQLMENPTAFARGQNWRTADFSGELTPFREGTSDITGKILLARQRGFFTMGQEEVPLPTLTLSALPLPPGAPPDFADTVGQYSITTKCDASTLAMNEAVEVQITVRGTGNLQQLACPAPDAPDAWKLVPATRKPIVSASGETVGMVFSQLMRPITEVDGIPAFSFSYFDPTAMAYKRAISPPIALTWRQTDTAATTLMQTAATPPPAGSVPVAELTDIYDFIPVNDDTQRTIVLPRALWYLLYLPGLLIFAYVAWRRGVRFLSGKSAERARERALSAISAEQDSLTFLKRIGAFIEAHVPEAARDDALQHVLQRRDDEAFRPGAKPDVPEDERAAMLQAVRKALQKSLSCLCFALFALLTFASANDGSPQELYAARQYSKALDILHKEQLKLGEDAPGSALLFYDMGTCQYRLGKPGEAALNFARALLLHPSFPEARANLDFIQRKEGALLPVRTNAERVFTLLSCGQLWIATIVCSAALLLCIGLHMIMRRHLAWLTAATALSAVLCLLCAVDWIYYTTRESADLSSLPPSDLAYVLRSTPLQTAASPDASMILRLTPSSPLHLLAQRGSFSYVETATGQRGWIASADIESLALPGSTPRLPISIRFR